MKKAIAILGCILLSMNLLKAQNPVEYDLETVRQMYYASVEDEVAAQQFWEYMEAMESKDGLMLAYQASAEALLSKHAWAPVKKINWLKTAEKTFAEAVAIDPQDAEVRFLRFSVQHFVPKFLGFSEDLTEDKVSIVRHLSCTCSLTDSPKLFNNVVDFMVESDRCTEKEIETLMNLRR